MRRRVTRPLLVALPLLAAVALGGCTGSDEGDDGGGSSGGSASAASTASEGTVSDWLTATVDGDVGACDLETPEFSDVANEASLANLGRPGERSLTCAQRIRRSASALADIGGDDYAATVKGATLETVDESADVVTVEATYTEDGQPTTFTLVPAGDAWLIDSDDAIAAPAG